LIQNKIPEDTRREGPPFLADSQLQVSIFRYKKKNLTLGEGEKEREKNRREGMSTVRTPERGAAVRVNWTRTIIIFQSWRYII